MEHCSKKEQFGLKLSEFALVRTQLAKIASKIYALESTAYMTAGLADASIDGDIEVESVITRQLASDTADFVVNNCLQLLGSSVHHESSKYQQYLRDSTVLVYDNESLHIVCVSFTTHFRAGKETRTSISVSWQCPA